MNVEKLHALAKDLLQDEEAQAVHLLQELCTHLQNQINAPQEPSYQQGVSETLQSIRENLNSAPSNNFSADWKDMMCSLEIDKFYGKPLLEQINSIFSENQITPVIALEKMQMISGTVSNNQTHWTKMVKAFKHFEIEGDELQSGECEISILIPREYLNNKMDKLGKELEQLSKVVLSPFVEASGETPDGFTIRRISSSDPIIYIEAIPQVAFMIMVAVKMALAIYKDILDLKKTRIELERMNVREATLSSLDEDIKDKTKASLNKYLEEFMQKTNSRETEGRTKEELAELIRGSLMQLIKRIDEGFSINVRGEQHQAEQEDEEAEIRELTNEQKQENKLIQQIQNARKELTYQNKDVTQLTELLPYFQNEKKASEESDDSEESKP